MPKTHPAVHTCQIHVHHGLAQLHIGLYNGYQLLLTSGGGWGAVGQHVQTALGFHPPKTIVAAPDVEKHCGANCLSTGKCR